MRCCYLKHTLYHKKGLVIAMRKSRKDPINVNMQRVSIVVLAVYIFLVAAFYFLAGEQLHLRDSRGNLELQPAEAGTIELVQGSVVEQIFTVEIQRLESVSVQWGNYYRENTGIVTMELLDTRDGTLLIQQQFNAAEIADAMVLSMYADTPIEGLYGVPLLLRVYADSVTGSAVTPLMSNSTMEGWQLTFNGAPISGTLCFSAGGQDYIWTGLHYWKLAAVGAMLLGLLFGVVCYRQSKGKRSYVVNALIAMQKYRFLIQQLVARDFKTKYKRSVLGVLWSFLNPLLTMIVQYFVFSTIFKADIPNYPVYLLIGIVSFNFFSEACGMSLTSILGNATLITKVYVPKYIYPLTRVMSSMINLGISLIPLLLVCLATGVYFQKSAVLAFYFLICLVIFSLGLGLLLSSSMVFFRDMQFLWSVLSMIWMYATPIFYPESILPDNFKIVLQINPLYHFLKNIRLCILDGISPEPSAYMSCLAISLVMLLLGAVIFRKSQDRFVLYL